MLSKSKIHFIHSLAQKKHRAAAQLFVAEGTKIVGDLLASRFHVKEIFALERWLAQQPHVDPAIEVTTVGERELAKISELTTPHEVLALVAIPAVDFEPKAFRDKFSLALEDVQDPGNLGSIIRLCDWFGVDEILASGKTVDQFNAKVVQATMGSIARVRVHYRDDFVDLIAELKNAGKPISATTLDGDDLYRATLKPNGLVLLGNEGGGLSPAALAVSTQRLRIPSFNANVARAESLNVAMAAGIVCSEFRRRNQSAPSPPVLRGRGSG